MSLTDCFSPDRVVMLQSRDKEGAISELVEILCASIPELREEQVAGAVWSREEQFSTRIAPAVAVPHARIPGVKGCYIAVGKSRKGIEYDVRDERRVHLIFLLIGSGKEHLEVLGELARLLQRPGLLQRLLTAAGRKEIHKLLTEPLTQGFSVAETEIASIMGEYAGELAERVNARVVMIHGDNLDPKLLGSLRRHGRSVVLVGTEDAGEQMEGALYNHFLLLPFKDLDRSNQVEFTMLMALSKGMIHKGDRVVNVFGLTGASLDTIVLTDVGRDFRLFFSLPMDERPAEGKLDQQVFMRAMQIVTELAREGREGKAVGTLLVLGDYEYVREYAQQLVINPFQGCQESERNILDPSLAETVKEFSRIDGAFVIRGDGVIMSAGTYLRIDQEVEGLESGLGARHTAAAGITLNSEAISICLSESTGRISLFRAGTRVLQV